MKFSAGARAFVKALNQATEWTAKPDGALFRLSASAVTQSVTIQMFVHDDDLREEHVPFGKPGHAGVEVAEAGDVFVARGRLANLAPLLYRSRRVSFELGEDGKIEVASTGWSEKLATQRQV